MVAAASLPAWAVLVVEFVRFIREAGWLSSSPGVPSESVPVEIFREVCPDCSPRLSCPAAILSCLASSPGPAIGVTILVLFTAANLGLLCARWRHGGTRTAPTRRGGGLVG